MKLASAKLDHYSVTFDNSEEYHHLKNEIFTHDQYYFETDNPTPVIIDGGAHIGLATLYFKKIYPEARITAIEPFPPNFKLLTENIWQNRLENVTTHQVALADKVGSKTFYSDSSDEHWFSTAGFVKGAWTGQQTSQETTVPTKPLSDFITGPVDLLKLDIEGAEVKVLQAARAQLHLVKEMMIEFHPGSQHQADHLLELLEKQGFTLEFWQKQKQIEKFPPNGLVLIHATRP